MSLIAWCLLSAALGAVICGLAVSLVAARRRAALERELATTGGEKAVAEARLADLQQQLEQQQAWVAEKTREFEKSVTLAAQRVMEERGRLLNEASRRDVEAVVKPFRDQLAEFRRRVDEIHSAEARARGALDEKIVQLTALNQAVSLQAERLATALTITSKSTGDWGETILTRILEDSGLKPGREYRLQHSVQGVDGERLQPDAVIFLPENRQLIVDAKVSNKAWTAYCAEKDEARRAQCLREHLASLRAHMKGLSARGYPRSPDLATVDFVLMFVPVEAALLTAFEQDPALYSDAYRQNIVLVSPSTLMAVVKLVEGIWTFQRRKESADEIAEAGRRLYDKLVNFGTTFLELGNSLRRSQDAYEKALGQLRTGRGSAMGLAEKMRELGVTPSAGKVLPAPLLPDAGEGEAGDGDSRIDEGA